MAENLCPCGTQRAYLSCCYPLISGLYPAADQLSLMRSRYSAYVKQAFDYLVETWHPSQRTQDLKRLLQQDSTHTQWLGLTIVAAEQADSEQGYVTFFARYLGEGNRGWIYETSRFIFQQQRWYYIDGVHHQPLRNEPCPCGSGKKFKRCCAA